MTNDEREWRRYLRLMWGLYMFSNFLLVGAVVTLVYRAKGFWDWFAVVLILGALVNLWRARLRP